MLQGLPKAPILCHTIRVKERETSMSLFTRLATSALVAITAIGAAATPTLAANDFAAHQDLWNAVSEVGVRTYINPKQCFGGKSAPDGFYVSNGGILAICQDNATKPGEQVDWTDNDLDTLRHEAIHLLQDMIDGRGDNSLPHVISDDGKRSEYVIGVLGRNGAARVIRSYSNRGVKPHQIHNELEAFAFAADVDASDIALALRRAAGLTK